MHKRTEQTYRSLNERANSSNNHESASLKRLRMANWKKNDHIFHFICHSIRNCFSFDISSIQLLIQITACHFVNLFFPCLILSILSNNDLALKCKWASSFSDWNWETTHLLGKWQIEFGIWAFLVEHLFFWIESSFEAQFIFT